MLNNNFKITLSDKKNIILSFLCFISFICYGYFACVLGASIPIIANKLNKNETSLGILFTARGFGFMFGTFLYTFITTIIKNKYIKNDYIVTISVTIAGFGSFILLLFNNIWILLCIVFIQGFVFAGIDVVANILLPNLWKGRVQPWLQTLHACWSLGGIIGPAILGSIGYYGSNVVLMILSFIPIVLLFINNIVENDNNNNNNESFFNSKKIQYMFQLRNISDFFSNYQNNNDPKKRYSKKTSKKNNNDNRDNDNDEDGDEEELEDDDSDGYDNGIQIRPLQDNKINSSNYVSSSATSSTTINYDFNSFSNHITDIDYDGDGENENYEKSRPSSSSSSSLPISSPISPTELIENSTNKEKNSNSNNGSSNNNSNNTNNNTELSSDSTSEHHSPDEYWTLPNSIRVLLFLFYFIYVGLETGYGGWIPTYAVERKIAKNDAEGAYLASIFFFAISAGRLTAIPLAAIYTPNFLIRIQLAIVIIGMILVTVIGNGIIGYIGLSIATGVLGYGISCIFPFNQLSQSWITH